MVRIKPNHIDEIARVSRGTTDDLIGRAKVLDPTDMRKLEKSMEVRMAGRLLSRDEQLELITSVEKLSLSKYLRWDQIVRDSDVVHHVFQADFRRYRKTHPNATPEQWARSSRSTIAAFLRARMGPNYKREVLIQSAEAAAKVIRRLDDFPEPVGLTGGAKRIYLDTLRNADPKLVKRRLDTYFKSDDYSDTVVEVGLLRNAKGNVGEVFARAEVLNIVDQFRTAYQRTKFADRIQLIDDVRIGGQEFTDGIIGYLDDAENLQVLAMTEVKNWTKPVSGVVEARRQFFDWLEDNVEEGATMTFSVADRKGNRVTRKVTYSPTSKSAAVRRLYSSEKVILYTPNDGAKDLDRFVVGFAGDSSVGMQLDDVWHAGGHIRRLDFNSGANTVGNVRIVPVRGVTSELLDWLSAVLLRTKGEL